MSLHLYLVELGTSGVKQSMSWVPGCRWDSFKCASYVGFHCYRVIVNVVLLEKPLLHFNF